MKGVINLTVTSWITVPSKGPFKPSSEAPIIRWALPTEARSHKSFSYHRKPEALGKDPLIQVNSQSPLPRHHESRLVDPTYLG